MLLLDFFNCVVFQVPLSLRFVVCFGFGFGLHTWTFITLLEKTPSEVNLTVDKMMRKFYGKNFWDSKEEKWPKINAESLFKNRKWCHFAFIFSGIDDFSANLYPFDGMKFYFKKMDSMCYRGHHHLGSLERDLEDDVIRNSLKTNFDLRELVKGFGNIYLKDLRGLFMQMQVCSF